jgi:hypothetical protein
MYKHTFTYKGSSRRALVMGKNWHLIVHESLDERVRMYTEQKGCSRTDLVIEALELLLNLDEDGLTEQEVKRKEAMGQRLLTEAQNLKALQVSRKEEKKKTQEIQKNKELDELTKEVASLRRNVINTSKKGKDFYDLAERYYVPLKEKGDPEIDDILKKHDNQNVRDFFNWISNRKQEAESVGE